MTGKMRTFFVLHGEATRARERRHKISIDLLKDVNGLQGTFMFAYVAQTSITLNNWPSLDYGALYRSAGTIPSVIINSHGPYRLALICANQSNMPA
jgi:hypothetical protein